MSILHIGGCLCGKVDEVPGHFYVSTRFIALLHFPIIPLGSVVVIDGSEQSSSNYRGRAIPLSPKSIAFAWIRGVLIFSIWCSFAYGVVVIIEERKWLHGAQAIFLGILLIGLFQATYKITAPSSDRVRELAIRLGWDPHEIEALVADELKESDSFEGPENR